MSWLPAPRSAVTGNLGRASRGTVRVGGSRYGPAEMHSLGLQPSRHRAGDDSPGTGRPEPGAVLLPLAGATPSLTTTSRHVTVMKITRGARLRVLHWAEHALGLRAHPRT